MTRYLVFVGFGLLCIAVGSVLIRVARKRRQLLAESQRWPHIYGEITRSQPKPALGAQGGWDLDVEFRYRLGRSDYTSDRFELGFAPRYHTKAAAENHLQAYPVGARVTVYYNPMDPGQACLQRSHRGIANLTYGGAGIVLFGVVFAILPYLVRA